MSLPILKTKLYIPPPQPNIVSRSRLMSTLGEGLQQRHNLTLVSAKAGSGKTTLVIEWLHRQEQPVAWLSLDAGDNDPRRFFSYLVATWHQLDPKIGQGVLSQLAAPGLPEGEALVVDLINDITTSLVPLIQAPG